MRQNHLYFSAAIATVMAAVVAQTSQLSLDRKLPLILFGHLGLVCAAGTVLRHFLPRYLAWLVWIIQAILGFGSVVVVYGSRVVQPDFWADLIVTAQVSSAPLPPHLGLSLMFTLLIITMTLFIEWFIFVAVSPGAAGLPLLTWYILLSLLPAPPPNPMNLVVVVVGYLLLLGVDSMRRSAHWSRAVERHTRSRTLNDTGIARLGIVIATVSIAGALIFTPFFPSFHLSKGAGAGIHLSLSDPAIDLRKQLLRPTPRPVLSYSTSAADGVRLRTAALEVFRNDGWSVREQKNPVRLDPQEKRLGPIPGRSLPIFERRSTSVDVGPLRSQYVPLPYATQELTLAGEDWWVDPQTLAVFSQSEQQDTLPQTYRTNSVDIRPTAEELSSVPVGTTDALLTYVPEHISPDVITLAHRIVENRSTALEKASAIQNFLRSEAFQYDLNSGPRSAGVEGLGEFLLEGRIGYCEHFAAAMAAMARIEGIPARVVIGFLPGKQVEQRYEVSSKDAHAWVELFFERYGWVEFDPTPAGVSGLAPAYSLPEAPAAAGPHNTPSPKPSASPTPNNTPIPTSQPSKAAPSSPTHLAQPVLPSWLIWLLVILACIMIVLAAPRALRSTINKRRLHSTTTAHSRTLSAWQELRDMVIDRSGAWPTDSPRAIAAALAHDIEPSTAKRVEKLAVAVEQSRFSLCEPGEDEWADTIAQVRRELDAKRAWWRKVLTYFFPVSLLALAGEKLHTLIPGQFRSTTKDNDSHI